jgi:hypothetical protein
MNSRKFLKEFEQSADRERMVDIIYNEMVAFCKENDITEDDISTPTLERLAEGFVERGFGVSPSEETRQSQERYTPSLEKMRPLSGEELQALKEMQNDYEEEA